MFLNPLLIFSLPSLSLNMYIIPNINENIMKADISNTSGNPILIKIGDRANFQLIFVHINLDVISKELISKHTN